MPTESDYMRLAAYIDGEGCIAFSHNSGVGNSVNNKPRGVLVTLCIINTDPRLPLWCKRTFGGRMRFKDKSDHSNFKRFGWYVETKAACEILKSCLPHFIIKREEAEVAIAYQETKKYHRWNPVPEEVKEQRLHLIQRMKTLKTTRPKIEDLQEIA